MLNISSLILLLLTGFVCAAEVQDETKTKFLQNEKVKIGVDLSSGGSIFWFSQVSDDRNLLNHADRGRFIQQSYYGKPDGSKWVEKLWVWNPVQGGDYQGRPAKVLEMKETGDSLYIKSIPVNWAGGQDIEECRMEEWITLKGEIAHLRFRFTYSGTETHPPRHQELPAMFVDFALPDLVSYQGENPWKGEPVSKERPAWPNEYRKSLSENWAGFVDETGRGIGLYFPGSTEITTYRHPGPDGPKGGGCSYFAPIRTMGITPGFVFEYEVYLTIGSVEEMRGRFQKIATGSEKPVGEKK